MVTTAADDPTLTTPDGPTLDADEFGTLAVGPAPGWLGGKQRSTDTLGGLVLMGVRLYNPILGRFLQVDPEPGGSANDTTTPAKTPSTHSTSTDDGGNGSEEPLASSLEFRTFQRLCRGEVAKDQDMPYDIDNGFTDKLTRISTQIVRRNLLGDHQASSRAVDVLTWYGASRHARSWQGGHGPIQLLNHIDVICYRSETP